MAVVVDVAGATAANSGTQNITAVTWTLPASIGSTDQVFLAVGTTGTQTWSAAPGNFTQVANTTGANGTLWLGVGKGSLTLGTTGTLSTARRWTVIAVKVSGLAQGHPAFTPTVTSLLAADVTSAAETSAAVLTDAGGNVVLHFALTRTTATAVTPAVTVDAGLTAVKATASASAALTNSGLAVGYDTYTGAGSTTLRTATSTQSGAWVLDVVPLSAVLPPMGQAAILNQLAGTSNLAMVGAANAWAGTTGLDLLGALNAKAGTTGLALAAVCNTLAGTTNMDPIHALNVAMGYQSA